MTTRTPLLFAALMALLFSSYASHAQTTTYGYQVPVTYDSLDNGLRVVLSPDTTAPTVIVGDKAQVNNQLQEVKLEPEK